MPLSYRNGFVPFHPLLVTDKKVIELITPNSSNRTMHILQVISTIETLPIYVVFNNDLLTEASYLLEKRLSEVMRDYKGVFITCSTHINDGSNKIFNNYVKNETVNDEVLKELLSSTARINNVYFIPQDKIFKYKKLFIKEFELGISLDDSDILSPAKYLNMEVNSNNINIVIVNNDDSYKCYYTKSLGKIIRIESITNNQLANGLYIDSPQHALNNNTPIPLSEINKYEIFHTEFEAEWGDLHPDTVKLLTITKTLELKDKDLLLKNKDLILKDKDIELANDKIKAEIIKLEQMKDKAVLELEKSKASNRALETKSVTSSISLIDTIISTARRYLF